MPKAPWGRSRPFCRCGAFIWIGASLTSITKDWLVAYSVKRIFIRRRIKIMISFLKKKLRASFSRAGYAIIKHNDLTRLADYFGSDKGTRFTAHLYTRVYEKYFGKLRNEAITILEIGLHRVEDDKRRRLGAVEGATSEAASRAPSLEMWRAYFPNASLYGFDIDDFTRVNIAGCEIIRGDMSSRDDLAKLVTAVGRPFDIIIEDASH